MKKGDYFIQDIIGLKVIDAENETVYGEVSDVAPTGANDIYCVCGFVKVVEFLKRGVIIL